MAKNKRIISTTIIIVCMLIFVYLIGTGFIKRTDVALGEYSVSEDGTMLTFHVDVMSSMGYVRGFKDCGGGVKPHYLTFYSAFGGLNSSLGEKSEFDLELDKTDTEIYFACADGGYELVLQKDQVTGEWIRADVDAEEVSVIKTYEATSSESAENDEWITMVKYYEMSDGTWKTDNHTYKYRLEITGRMGNADKDTTFVFLSNLKEITFEQAWKASGFSSNMNDYFDEEDAKFVAMK